VDLVVVDGPNLFTAVGRRITTDFPAGSSAHAAYLEEWFDIDRLVGVTIDQVERFPGAGPAFGIVVFRSTQALGRYPYGIADRFHVEEFWGRQARLPNTREILVQIPDCDVEVYTCRACGAAIPDEQRDRAIDASMMCYLLESVQRWLSVCLFATDADFVPLVQALRRRDRCVFVAADDPGRADVLLRAAHSLLCWPHAFLVQDRQWFELARKGGAIAELAAAVTSIAGKVVIKRDPQSLSVTLTAQDGEMLDAMVAAAVARVPFLPANRAIRAVPEGTQASITFGLVADQSWATYLSSGLDRHLSRLASSGGWDEYVTL
jgi:hypothetical protein